MPRIVAIELFELDLPFRHAFHHAATTRDRSGSLFLRCFTESGHCGFGETLPRAYVTHERRGATFDLLAERILPRVLGMNFASFREVHDFLVRCDGKAPAEWVDPQMAHGAAWCAVDLALLDTFGRALGTELHHGLPDGGPTAGDGLGSWPDGLHYSLVLSIEPGLQTLLTLLKARLYGLRDAKVKVDGHSLKQVRLARRVLGPRARLRVDGNMAWTYGQAREEMARMQRYGVESFEQPLAAHDTDAIARLTAETGLAVMVDESFHDAASLERLIAARACTGFNVRIVKCGGLVAAVLRCRRLLQAGFKLQIGCQVGETSHLAAAQMVLVRTVAHGVSYLEGCFGQRLLQTDPVRPLLQFRWGGRPPRSPKGAGFGTRVDMNTIRRFAGRHHSLGSAVPHTSHEMP